MKYKLCQIKIAIIAFLNVMMEIFINSLIILYLQVNFEKKNKNIQFIINYYYEQVYCVT
jgi:hypothetical protein